MVGFRLPDELRLVREGFDWLSEERAWDVARGEREGGLWVLIA